jgi:hypothetical protein
MIRLLFALVLFFSGCAPANLGELRCEGEAEMRRLTVELRGLSSYEDVQKDSKRLKKHFNRIAKLLIETRNFSPSAGLPKATAAGEELFAELARIYEIPGARAVIETAQSEAIHRLDRSNRNDGTEAGPIFNFSR